MEREHADRSAESSTLAQSCRSPALLGMCTYLEGGPEELEWTPECYGLGGGMSLALVTSQRADCLENILTVFILHIV